MVPYLALLLVGASLLPMLGSQLRPVLSRDLPGIRLMGGGSWFVAAGGYRTILADWFWLEANKAWERQEADRTTNLIHLAATADPQCLYFWLNGARILCYDIPVWQTAGHNPPAGVVVRWRKEAAGRALAFLDEAEHWHSRAPELAVEKGNIAWRALGDLEAAAQHYRRAAQLPGAPFYAGRIHAELLVALGRMREARDWLRELLPRLPAGNPDARVPVVRERLLYLERQVERPEK